MFKSFHNKNVKKSSTNFRNVPIKKKKITSSIKKSFIKFSLKFNLERQIKSKNIILLHKIKKFQKSSTVGKLQRAPGHYETVLTCSNWHRSIVYHTVLF